MKIDDSSSFGREKIGRTHLLRAGIDVRDWTSSLTWCGIEAATTLAVTWDAAATDCCVCANLYDLYLLTHPHMEGVPMRRSDDE
jgi:hypothetical protein